MYQCNHKPIEIFRCSYYPFVKRCDETSLIPVKFDDNPIDKIMEHLCTMGITHTTEHVSLFYDMQRIIIDGSEEIYSIVKNYKICNDVVLHHYKQIEERQFPIINNYHKDDTYEQIIIDCVDFCIVLRKYKKWIMFVSYTLKNIDELHPKTISIREHTTIQKLLQLQ